MLDSAFQIVTVVFILISIGFFSERNGWLGANALTLLSRLTLRIGLPGLIFSNILTNYHRAELLSGAKSLLVPLLVIGLMYLLTIPLTKWLKIPEGRVGVFRALFSLGNSVFVGMPVCLAIFGERQTSNVLLYYLVNTIIWWTVGAPLVAKDGGNKARGALSRLATPPLITVVTSLLLVFAGFTPPAFLLQTASYLGGIVTPVSMVFIGCSLCTMVTSGLRWQKGYGAILLGRFLLGPVLCLPLCRATGITGDMLGVFFLQSGMPCQTQTCLWAQEQGADAGYAAGAISLTTLLSLAMIPAQTWFLSLLAR